MEKTERGNYPFIVSVHCKLRRPCATHDGGIATIAGFGVLQKMLKPIHPMRNGMMQVPLSHFSEKLSTFATKSTPSVVCSLSIWWWFCNTNHEKHLIDLLGTVKDAIEPQGDMI